MRQLPLDRCQRLSRDRPICEQARARLWRTKPVKIHEQQVSSLHESSRWLATHLTRSAASVRRSLYKSASAASALAYECAASKFCAKLILGKDRIKQIRPAKRCARCNSLLHNSTSATFAALTASVCARAAIRLSPRISSFHYTLRVSKRAGLAR